MSKLEQEHYYLKFSLYVMSQLPAESSCLSLLCRVFESHPDIALGDALPVKAMIMQALQSLHGEVLIRHNHISYLMPSLQVGVAAPVDILKCSSTSPTALEAIVRVPYRSVCGNAVYITLYCCHPLPPSSQLVRVWSALTLVGTYSGTACVVNVLKVRTITISLAWCDTAPVL